MIINTLGFIGAGNMAGAIINGLISSGFDTGRLHICARTEATLAPFRDLGCHVTTDTAEIVKQCDAVVLAVKPQMLKAVLEPLASIAQEQRPLFISVVAAIEATTINAWLGGGQIIIRSMPNTPTKVQEGATGLFANEQVNDEQKAFAETVFKGIGSYCWVEDEALIHSVTAAAGSAPAYFFRFAEAMSKTAEKQGLSPEQARLLISQTMLGAAKMIMQETDTSVSQLCLNVCSPNGTTERAIQSFNHDNIDQMVENAMKACFDRSVELSELLAD